MSKIKFLILTAIFLSTLSCSSFPGGTLGISLQIPGVPPTAKQAKVMRSENRVLINGQPVDKSQWPSVVRIFIGSSACTANVVGKRVIITAAHCGETGQTATFTTISGRKYSALLQRAPGYPNKDLDLNIGITSMDIDVTPMSIRIDRFERKGMDVTMIGYGCINPGGTGGNDGILRIGQSKVVAGQGYDLLLQNPNGAALCYGDSGGPLFYNDNGKYVQIAVNSKGNIQDTSYCTRTTLDEAIAFLKTVPGVCGVTMDCDSGSTPPPSNPNISEFEDSKFKVRIEAK